MHTQRFSKIFRHGPMALAAGVVTFGVGIAHADPGDSAFSIDGSYFGASGDYIVAKKNPSVKLYSAITGESLGVFFEPENVLSDSSFGDSISIDGDFVVIGESGRDVSGESSAGAAYIFDVVTGVQLHRLLPSTSGSFQRFGYDVAINGLSAIVGAYTESNENGTASGAAYIYDVTTGGLVTRLVPDDGELSDTFGRSVDVDGAVAIVGSTGDDDNGVQAGAAYLFDASTGLQLFKLLADDGDDGDSFGYDVALCGNTAVVGARDRIENGVKTGAVYLFDVTTGQQIGKLLPPNGSEGDRFGQSVACDGTSILIGAPQQLNTVGTIYLFDLDTQLLISELIPTGPAGFSLGRTVALSGNEALAVGSSKVWSFDAEIDPILPVQPPVVTVVNIGDGPLDLSVTASGFGNFSYQWRLDGAAIGESAVFSGTATSVLTVELPSPATVGMYDVVITSQFGSSVSEPSVLAVRNMLPSDINGDGVVDTADLGILIGTFGTMSP